jgi:hypothetical protein
VLTINAGLSADPKDAAENKRALVGGSTPAHVATPRTATRDAESRYGVARSIAMQAAGRVGS